MYCDSSASVSVLENDDRANGKSHGNPMGMGIDDTTGNRNWKEWESPCMGMRMALIPMGIK